MTHAIDQTRAFFGLVLYVRGLDNETDFLACRLRGGVKSERVWDSLAWPPSLPPPLLVILGLPGCVLRTLQLACNDLTGCFEM